MVSPQSGIRVKLIVLIVFSQAVAALVFAIPVIQGKDAIIFREVEEASLARARLAARLLGPFLLEHDDKGIARGLSLVCQGQAVDVAMLRDSRQVLSRHGHGRPGPVSFQRPPVAAGEVHRAGSALVARVPISPAHAQGIWLEIHSHVDAVAARIQDATVQITAFLLLALISGVLVALGLSWQITGALETLVLMVRRVAAGDLSSRVDIPTGDELHGLGEELNEMAAHISKTQAQLLEVNRKLDSRVAERTRELETVHQRLLASERLAAIGQMSAQAAHEIRNPLGTIRLNLDMLEEALEELPQGGDTEARGLLERINEQVSHLSDLTGDYLAFSRLRRLNLAPERLQGIVEKSREMLQALFEEKGIILELLLDEEIAPLPLDARKIQMCLVNLLKNACEAVPPGGHVTVRAERSEDAVVVHVVDDGPGIQDDEIARVFEPFYSTKPLGTGLGLPLCQAIVTEHGGALSCERRREGGTSFMMVLPLAGPPSLEPFATSGSVPPKPEEGDDSNVQDDPHCG